VADGAAVTICNKEELPGRPAANRATPIHPSCICPHGHLLKDFGGHFCLFVTAQIVLLLLLFLPLFRSLAQRLSPSSLPKCSTEDGTKHCLLFSPHFPHSKLRPWDCHPCQKKGKSTKT
jgi:hypothetical protein